MTSARSEAQRQRRMREAWDAGRFVVVNGYNVELGRQRCRETRLGTMHAPSCRHQEPRAELPKRPRGRPKINRRSIAQRARRERERNHAA